MTFHDQWHLFQVRCPACRDKATLCESCGRLGAQMRRCVARCTGWVRTSTPCAAKLLRWPLVFFQPIWTESPLKSNFRNFHSAKSLAEDGVCCVTLQKASQKKRYPTDLLFTPHFFWELSSQMVERQRV